MLKQVGKINQYFIIFDAYNLQLKLINIYTMHSDSISDYLTRLRNAIMAQHKIVKMPLTKIKCSITKLLFKEGYIYNYKFDINTNKPIITIFIKYFNNKSTIPVIKNITRISKCSIRKYTKVNNIPRVLNGMGMSILSTSKGIISDKEARKLNVGGEIICTIY